MTHHICWTELHARDRAKAMNFYTELFGWNFTSIPKDKGTYEFTAITPEPGAGFLEGDGGWMPYVDVEDLAASTGRAVELGATVLAGPLPFDAGHYVMLRDPDGNRMGLIEAAKPA